ncbi:High affinity Ca2+/Mn2+ P-type ATPase-like protein, partial [Ceratobasidium sp. 428]
MAITTFRSRHPSPYGPSSAVLGSLDDAVSITVAIIIVIPVEAVLVGWVQARRSEESLAALNKFMPHYCHDIR